MMMIPPRLTALFFAFIPILIDQSHAFLFKQNSTNRQKLALLKERISNNEEGSVSADSVYFEIEISDTPIGRLVFHLTNPSPLPLHTENIIQLAKGSRRGIDPKAHYVGCAFDFTPAAIEDGSMRYRWGHQLKGRGRNAVGRPDQAIIDTSNQLKHTNSCFGGQ
jgi:hypothetical protein